MNTEELYIKDIATGRIRRVGDDPYDSIYIKNGKLHYENTKRGDRCILGEASEGCRCRFVDNAEACGAGTVPEEERDGDRAVYDGYLYFCTDASTTVKAASSLKRAFRAAGVNIFGWDLVYELRKEDRKLFLKGSFCVSPFPGDEAFREACRKQDINVENLVKREMV